MSEGEFDLIEKFFTHAPFGAWTSNGVGDDCAIIDIGEKRLAVTTDMLSGGVHFLPSALPYDIGYKALAVNLSDLAASGSTPRAFFLSLALAERNDEWLSAFSSGLMDLAKEKGCALLGGDTTRLARVENRALPFTLSITALGELPHERGLTRQGAKPGDDVWVSGTVGGAHAALQHLQKVITLRGENAEKALLKLNRPIARNALGVKLLDVATACADISDGLAQDLTHILRRSAVAANLYLDALPYDEALKALPLEIQRNAALTGGDDYELIFTAPESKREALTKISQDTNTPLTRVGKIVAKENDKGDLRFFDAQGNVLCCPIKGFNHFTS